MFIIHRNKREEIKMKKILATLLCITTVMSLAACNKKTEPTGETTAIVTFESFPKVSGEASATAATVANPASEFVKDKVEKVKLAFEADPEDGGEEEEEETEFHYPELQIKSAYADEINKEVSGAVKKYLKDLEKEDAEHFFATAYIPYLSKDNILSIVFISYEETDMNIYKVYNIDVKTGEKVDNARIAKAAGVTDIRKAAMDALQNWYNNMAIVKVKDYKVVPEDGAKIDEQMKDVEKSFSEKYLNDKMQIGLTGEGKIFFVSQVCTMAGAEFYDWLYDAGGSTLDDEDNPYWVGMRIPEEEDDEGEEGEEGEDEDLPDDPDDEA